jgi:hypothetical protein
MNLETGGMVAAGPLASGVRLVDQGSPRVGVLDWLEDEKVLSFVGSARDGAVADRGWLCSTLTQQKPRDAISLATS